MRVIDVVNVAPGRAVRGAFRVLRLREIERAQGGERAASRLEAHVQRTAQASQRSALNTALAKPAHHRPRLQDVAGLAYSPRARHVERLSRCQGREVALLVSGMLTAGKRRIARTVAAASRRGRHVLLLG